MIGRCRGRYRQLFAALTLFLVTAGAVHAGPAAPEPAEAASIAVQTPGPATEGCVTTRVEIWAKDITGLYGIDVKVTFDPAVLQVVDADPATTGIQITPLSGFLKPDFVVKKIACNSAGPTDPDCATAGLVWYAATQTSPTAPASGSGALAAVDFVGVAEGLSTLQIVYSEPVDSHGNLIPATTTNAQLAANPPVAPAVTVSLPSPTTPRLSWAAIPGAGSYRVYRRAAPYFSPAEPPYASTAQLFYEDSGAAGDPQVNHFYVVKSICGNGLASSGGNRTGEFDYGLIKP